MSTTLDHEVAMTYASDSGIGIVLAIRQGMVNRGADISWLSQYPHEKECAAALAQSSQTNHCTLSHTRLHTSQMRCARLVTAGYCLVRSRASRC